MTTPESLVSLVKQAHTTQMDGPHPVAGGRVVCHSPPLHQSSLNRSDIGLLTYFWLAALVANWWWTCVVAAWPRCSWGPGTIGIRMNGHPHGPTPPAKAKDFQRSVGSSTSTHRN